MSVSVPRLSAVGWGAVRDRFAAAERSLWLYALAVLALDVALTAHGLERGFVESNPVARAAMSTFGLWPAMIALKALAVAVALAGRRALPVAYRSVSPAALAAPWTVATVVNASLLL
jgi:uncharacterized membrane protein